MSSAAAKILGRLVKKISKTGKYPMFSEIQHSRGQADGLATDPRP
ncbi:MAG: hypothetical protein ACK4P4_14225 [Allorhizobium sp.]